jgi:Zn-dependent peptidase ImmA (M78 family)
LVQINADRSFVVNLSPYSMPARDTFSLAHAIGRVALHTPEHIEKPIKYDRTFVDKQTSEANIFAAILLMPKDRYLQAKERLSDDMRRVAWEFDVHQDNLKIRETLLHRGL